jgi:hypothetical protein
VATPYGVLDGVAMFNWTGTAWTPAPSLALNFMTPGTLDQRITFTRASTATYFDVTGTLQTAAVNAPRWDYDPVTHVLRGLLIEEARTNLWLQSADASNAAWLKASGVVASPVVTANQTTAPDGTLTAARVVFPAVVGGGAFSVIAQGITATAAVYTFSVWLKGSVGGEQLYINANNGNPYSDSPRLTLTTQWQRITLVTASLAAASYFFNIGTDLRDVGQATTSASTIFVWGAQVELGAFPTSYIPTAGATVTRAIDLCSIPPANMGFYTPPGGSWMAEFISNISAPTNTRIIGTNASGPTQLFEGSGPVVAQFDGAAIVGTVNSLTVGAVSKAASNWAAGTGKTCLNGGTVTPGAMATGYAATATSGVAFLNSVGGGSATDAMTGYLRRVRYWPRVLSDAEMQAVTT